MQSGIITPNKNCPTTRIIIVVTHSHRATLTIAFFLSLFIFTMCFLAINMTCAVTRTVHIISPRHVVEKRQDRRTVSERKEKKPQSCKRRSNCLLCIMSWLSLSSVFSLNISSNFIIIQYFL